MTNDYLLPLNIQFFAEETTETKDTPTEVKTFTQAELDNIIADRLARAKKDVPQDYDELKTRVADFEKAEKKRKETEMTEVERVQAQLAEKEEQAQAYVKQLDAVKSQVEREKIHHAFTTAAVGANIAHVEDAIRLADLSEAKVEDGKAW